jgi:predicted GNAT family N-acyltransferase
MELIKDVSVSIQVRLGQWDEIKDQAMPIRLDVFVHEQKVPIEEEVDEMDPLSVHALAFNDTGLVVGTGRLLPDGHIGRMSVLQAYRGLGVGSAVLAALMERAQALDFSEVILHAQTHAKSFYSLHGFEQEGEIFYEANIPHVIMRRRFV